MSEQSLELGEEQNQRIMAAGQKVAAAMAEAWVEQITEGLDKDIYPCRLLIVPLNQEPKFAEELLRRTVAAPLISAELSKIDDILLTAAQQAVTELFSQLRELVAIAKSKELFGDPAGWSNLRLALRHGPEVFFGVRPPRQEDQDWRLEGYLVVQAWIARVSEEG